MDSIYCTGFFGVLWLQERFVAYENVMLASTHLADPKNAFLVLFPITFALDKRLGLHVLWISAVCEWVNTVFKWLVLDDRPYWWTKVSSCSSSYKLEMLRQFQVTCESGPGFPSGHVMSITAVGLALVLFCTQFLRGRARILAVPLWILYVVLVLFGAVSRVYIATHFPHQVFAAVFVGIAVALVVRSASLRYSEETLFSPKASLAGLAMLSSGLLIYSGLAYLGFNPQVTVELALRHCKHRSWVHLGTTLFYALARDFAVLFGLGIASASVTWKCGGAARFLKAREPLLVRALCALVCAALVQCMELVVIPQHSAFTFYVGASVKLMVVPLLVVGVCLIAHSSFISANQKSKSS